MTIMGTLVQFAAFGYCLFRLWTGDIDIRNHDTVPAAEKQSLLGIQQCCFHYPVISEQLRIGSPYPRIGAAPERDTYSGEQRDGQIYGERFRGADAGCELLICRGTRVITDSAFEANPGEIVALVGPSGEGKTTMIRLILGLVRPENGEVKLRASTVRKLR